LDYYEVPSISELRGITAWVSNFADTHISAACILAVESVRDFSRKPGRRSPKEEEMISPLINSFVVAGFGFFIGIVLQIAMSVMPERNREPHSLKFNRGLRGFIDDANKSAEESREMIRTAGPVLWMGMFAFYALIAILILIIIYSPLVMNWLVFLLAFFTGFGLFEWIFTRAKAGKMAPASSSPDDSPPKSTMSGG
jgi:hypothetical protein